MVKRNAAYILALLVTLLLLGPATVTAAQTAPVGALPRGFVYVSDVVPEALVEIRYYSSNNFTGAPVPGYTAPVAILSSQAALALQKVSATCQSMGYGIKIFDAYRPQSAVDYFVKWSKQPEDNIAKAAFYPNIAKSQLFKLGYLASRSGHSRGATVDLTLVDLTTGLELDMGTPFDFLDPRSHFNAQDLTNEQIFNRMLLRTVMENNGFKAYNKEWWHFTLMDEPFADTYFNFEVR